MRSNTAQSEYPVKLPEESKQLAGPTRDVSPGDRITVLGQEFDVLAVDKSERGGGFSLSLLSPVNRREALKEPESEMLGDGEDGMNDVREHDEVAF